MSTGFCAVQWNRDKVVYDMILAACVGLYLAGFIAIGKWSHPLPDALAVIDLRIRAFGTCAFLMLTVVLAIGPLSRLQPRFHKLLYNRRHFGVLTFCAASLHAGFMIEWYQAQGELPSLWNELTAWANYRKFIGFPFKTLLSHAHDIEHERPFSQRLTMLVNARSQR